MILDASHAGGVFGSDTQGFAFVFRTDDAPEMDYPIRDNDASLTCVRPFLFPQLGEQLPAERAVLLFVIGRSVCLGRPGGPGRGLNRRPDPR